MIPLHMVTRNKAGRLGKAGLWVKGGCTVAIGMRDVAKKAGVSPSTVSLVVNQAGYVSDAMRAKVERAMEELNYVPNELARNLYHDRTNMVGVIVPTIRHPFFSSLSASLQHVFMQHGLRTLLCSTVDAETGEAKYVDMARRHMMDGLVVAAHSAHSERYWTSIGRPIVAFDRYLADGIASVGSDHEQGGMMIAQLLIPSGVRHVVMVGGPLSQFHDMPIASGTTFPTVRYFMALQRECLRAAVRCDYVEAGTVSDMSAYAQAIHDVFSRWDDVDAVVSSDIGAAYCVQEALRRGVSIPRDLQVVAYDGTYLADFAGMRLTAVRQDCDGIAAVIATHMLDGIEHDSNGGDDGLRRPRRDVVPVTLVRGETTRA